MSDKNESRMKERVLFQERFLLAHSDEKHPVTTAELIYACEEKGYNANRNTIHADMVALSASGLDVQSKRVGNAKGYYVDVRLFEYSALRMLVDAVSSSRFITERKSKELIGKIGRLTSDFMAEQLRTTIHTFKSNNPTAVRGTARMANVSLASQPYHTTYLENQRIMWNWSVFKFQRNIVIGALEENFLQ